MVQYAMISGFKRESCADGFGLRYVVFFQGCPYHCPGCHNAGTHDKNGGDRYELPVLLEKILHECDDGKVTFSGGEPMAQPEAVLWLADQLSSRGLELCLYTGGRAEALPVELVSKLRYVKDGPYIASQRDLSLPFRGSRNQRFLEVIHHGENISFREVA